MTTMFASTDIQPSLDFKESMPFGDLVEIFLRDPQWRMLNGIRYVRPDFTPEATCRNGQKIYTLSVSTPGDKRSEMRSYRLRSDDDVTLTWAMPREMFSLFGRHVSMLPFYFSRITDYYAIRSLARDDEKFRSFLPLAPKNGHDNESDFQPDGLMGQRMGRRRTRVKDPFGFNR